jgi:hypothetical protein
MPACRGPTRSPTNTSASSTSPIRPISPTSTCTPRRARGSTRWSDSA